MDEDVDVDVENNERERVLLPDCGTLSAPSPAIEMRILAAGDRNSPPMPPPRWNRTESDYDSSVMDEAEDKLQGSHPSKPSSSSTTPRSRSVRFDPLSLRFWATSGPFIVALGISGYVYYVFNFIVCIDVLLNNHGVGSAAICTIVYHIIMGFWITSYFRCVFTNPGDIPDSYASDEEAPSMTISTSSAPISSPSPPPRTRMRTSQSNSNNNSNSSTMIEMTSMEEMESLNATSVEQKGKTGGKRFCSKCYKYKPDRSHHCSICQRCILKMDHHCPWVNNCVGWGNYKFFVLFLIYTILLALSISIMNVPALRLINWKNIEGYQYQIVIVEFICCLLTFGIGGFASMHIQFALENVTTIESYEKRRRSDAEDINPYNVGSRANWEQVFGKNPWLWFMPVATGLGNGCVYPIREDYQRLLDERRSSSSPSDPINFVLLYSCCAAATLRKT